MASRANWAKMSVNVGGTGSITLAAVTNFPTFAKKHGTGSTDIEYVIYDATTGVYETGTGTYNGTTHVLSARTVTESYTAATYGTSAISAPTTAVVFSGATLQSVTDFMAGVLSASDDAAEARAALGFEDGGNVTQDGFFVGDDVGDGYPVISEKTPAQVLDILDLPVAPSDAGFILGHAAPTTSIVLAFFAPCPGTFTTSKFKTTSGTCTYAANIAGTPVTGFGSAVSSSVDTDTATAAHTFAKGDEITVTFSAASSPVDFRITLNFDRI